MLFQNNHLSYCTNIHAYGSVSELLVVLENAVAQVASNFASPFAAGLYLSSRVVEELLDSPGKLKALKGCLVKHHLYVCSLNCFPYGNFHNCVVKESVYLPHWGDQRRVDYTCKAATILDQLLPEGQTGTISTVPIAYLNELPALAFENINQTLTHFSKLDHKIVLALEPEPDCYLDDLASCLTFFELAKSEIKPKLYPFLGLCFDTCHFSVLFEEPIVAFKKLQAAGVNIPKVQISSAIVTTDPEKLKPFAEPTYLHQTAIKLENGTIIRYKDLDKAISEAYFKNAEWRVHFHLPIYLEITKEGLGTTNFELVPFLEFLATIEDLHVEVETYSLGVIPGEMLSAEESTIKELTFLLKNLALKTQD